MRTSQPYDVHPMFNLVQQSTKAGFRKSGGRASSTCVYCKRRSFAKFPVVVLCKLQATRQRPPCSSLIITIKISHFTHQNTNTVFLTPHAVTEHFSPSERGCCCSFSAAERFLASLSRIQARSVCRTPVTFCRE